MGSPNRSKISVAEWADKRPCRKSRTHSNHLVWGVTVPRSLRSHKRTGRRWSASSPCFDARSTDTSKCFATEAQPPLGLALAGKPASVITRAMSPMLARSESKSTVTVAALASTRRVVTPGIFSSAFSMVRVHAGHVMFWTSSTTFWGLAAAASPVAARATKARINLRIDRILEKPDNVIRKGKQYCDQYRSKPQPPPPAAHHFRFHTRTGCAASRSWSIQRPERICQTHHCGPAEPGPPGVECRQVSDPGTTDTQNNQYQWHDATYRSTDGGQRRHPQDGDR